MLTVVAVLVGMGVSVAAPIERAPAVLPVSAPTPDARERAPALAPVQVARRAFTKWCAGPSGVRIVAPCTATDSGYAGEAGSYSFTVSNPTPNDVGYHA
ncbi:MAG: hypothetical protein ACRENC_08790, partial [Gemmatimonadaceae bacterium]